LAWMRLTFWKHNKTRLAGKIGQEREVSDANGTPKATRTHLAEALGKEVQRHIIPRAQLGILKPNLWKLRGRCCKSLKVPMALEMLKRILQIPAAASSGIFPDNLFAHPAVQLWRKNKDTNI